MHLPQQSQGLPGSVEHSRGDHKQQQPAQPGRRPAALRYSSVSLRRVLGQLILAFVREPPINVFTDGDDGVLPQRPQSAGVLQQVEQRRPHPRRALHLLELELVAPRNDGSPDQLIRRYDN